MLLRSNSVFNCCGEFCSKLLTTMTMNVCLIWVNEDWSLPSTEFLASFWILEEPFHGFLVDVCWFCTASIYHFYRDKTLLCLASTALYEKYQGLSHPALFCKTPRIQELYVRTIFTCAIFFPNLTTFFLTKRSFSPLSSSLLLAVFFLPFLQDLQVLNVMISQLSLARSSPFFLLPCAMLLFFLLKDRTGCLVALCYARTFES